MSSKRKRGSSGAAAASSHQWMFLLPDKETAQPNFKGQILTLPHPRSGESTHFMLGTDGKCVYELQAFDDECPRSWFVDQAVQNDGRLFLTSPVDPLFLLLPFLEKAAAASEGKDDDGVFTTLDQIIASPDFDDASVLGDCVQPDDLELVCDVVGAGGGMQCCRFNREKTTAWLRNKVTKLAKALLESKVHMGQGAQSAAFARSTKTAHAASWEDAQAYAFGMVSEYLAPSLADLVGGDYKAAELLPGAKPSPGAKKAAKQYSGVPDEDYSRGSKAVVHEKKKIKLTTAQKSLEKVNKKGMKSMTSFFTKKKK